MIAALLAGFMLGIAATGWAMTAWDRYMARPTELGWSRQEAALRRLQDRQP